MAKVMVTLELEPSEATPARVRRKYKLAKDDLDARFGVVCLSPEERLYAVLVEDDVAAKLGGAAGVKGPFANPRIEPFGPAAGAPADPPDPPQQA